MGGLLGLGLEAEHNSLLSRTPAAYATETARAISCCPDWLGWMSQLNWFGDEAFSSPALHRLLPANGFEGPFETP